jgi:replicative DNA helicase
VHDTMELIVAKNRHGPIGTVKVRADMAMNLITDFASEADQGGGVP